MKHGEDSDVGTAQFDHEHHAKRIGVFLWVVFFDGNYIHPYDIISCGNKQ